MPYEYMRELLGNVRHSLSTTFERGLSYPPDADELARLQHQMEQAGLADGAAGMKALRAELLRLRIDPHWTAQRAVDQFSCLWGYVRLCERRLEYLEAEEAIAASAFSGEEIYTNS